MFRSSLLVQYSNLGPIKNVVRVYNASLLSFLHLIYRKVNENDTLFPISKEDHYTVKEWTNSNSRYSSITFIMLPSALQSIGLTMLIFLLMTHRTTALPMRRDLIEPDLGAHNCFEEKRDLIYPDLGAHNCGGWGGRRFRGGCCREN